MTADQFRDKLLVLIEEAAEGGLDVRSSEVDLPGRVVFKVGWMKEGSLICPECLEYHFETGSCGYEPNSLRRQG